MINKTVGIDRRLNGLSIESHLLYLMTIPHLDRDGLIAGDAPLLASIAVPRRTELHPHIDALVQEWIDCELVSRYEGPDTSILFFTGFRDNQSFQYSKEGASIFPPPPGYVRTVTGLNLEQGKATLERVQSDSRVDQELRTVKLSEDIKEVKLSECVGTEPEPTEPTQPATVLARASVTRTTGVKPNNKLSPQVNRVVQIIRKYPPRQIHHLIDAAVDARDDDAFMRKCYEEWLLRGFKGENFAWLTEWYVSGVIPDRTTSKGGTNGKGRLNALQTIKAQETRQAWNPTDEELAAARAEFYSSPTGAELDAGRREAVPDVQGQGMADA